MQNEASFLFKANECSCIQWSFVHWHQRELSLRWFIQSANSSVGIKSLTGEGVCNVVWGSFCATGFHMSFLVQESHNNVPTLHTNTSHMLAAGNAKKSGIQSEKCKEWIKKKVCTGGNV